MSAKVPYANQESTGRVIHISEVNKDDREKYTCRECKKDLIPVKSEARKKDWHFRHPAGSNINKCRNTALHDRAVQVLMENSTIALSQELRINYSEGRKEIWVGTDYRSDVTVKYQAEDLHFEVFVTSDIKPKKKEFYETSKIKCCRIDLSDKSLLSASPEDIIDIVLNQYGRKTLFGWHVDQPKKWDEEPKTIWGIILVIIGYFIFFGSDNKK